MNTTMLPVLVWLDLGWDALVSRYPMHLQLNESGWACGRKHSTDDYIAKWLGLSEYEYPYLSVGMLKYLGNTAQHCDRSTHKQMRILQSSYI